MPTSPSAVPLAVNCHGRYVGLGPIAHSVRSIRLVLADASVIDASRTQNSELFFAAIGGYGSVGVITEAELDLADNHRLQAPGRQDERCPVPAPLQGQGPQRPAGRLPQRRSLPARVQPRALRHLGRDRTRADRAMAAARKRRRLPAAQLPALGGHRHAAGQVAPRVPHRPAGLPPQGRALAQTTKPATTWPSWSRRHASTPPTCCRSTSLRPNASRNSCRRWPRS